MRIILAIMILILASAVDAQFSKDEWHDGMLVTTDGDTVRGQLQYDMETNSVQVYNKLKTLGFSAFKVFYFEIYDKVYANYREFYTLPFSLKGDYETPVIFELLFEGSLSLLAREKIVTQTDYANSQFSYGPRITTSKLAYDFYFLDQKGKMTFYSGSKSDLLSVMADKRNEVKGYIRDNRLKTNDIKDLVRITSFYNSI